MSQQVDAGLDVVTSDRGGGALRRKGCHPRKGVLGTQVVGDGGRKQTTTDTRHEVGKAHVTRTNDSVNKSRSLKRTSSNPSNVRVNKSGNNSRCLFRLSTRGDPTNDVEFRNVGNDVGKLLLGGTEAVIPSSSTRSRAVDRVGYVIKSLTCRLSDGLRKAGEEAHLRRRFTSLGDGLSDEFVECRVLLDALVGKSGKSNTSPRCGLHEGRGSEFSGGGYFDVSGTHRFDGGSGLRGTNSGSGFSTGYRVTRGNSLGSN